MPRQEPGEPYARITSDEAAEMFGSDDVVFVDVRRPDEYVGGHVKEALFITVDDLLAGAEFDGAVVCLSNQQGPAALCQLAAVP